jgi:hypothetical protein
MFVCELDKPTQNILHKLNDQKEVSLVDFPSDKKTSKILCIYTGARGTLCNKTRVFNSNIDRLRWIFSLLIKHQSIVQK